MGAVSRYFRGLCLPQLVLRCLALLLALGVLSTSDAGQAQQRSQRNQSAANSRGLSAGAAESLVLRGKTTETENYLQKAVRDAISGLLTTPYSLSVRIELDQAKLNNIKEGFRANNRLTQADRDRLFLSTIEQMSPLGFLANVKKKNVTLIVDASTKQDTVSAVQQAISQAIDMNQSNGDVIKIDTKDLSVEDSATKKKLEETTRALQETESDLRSTKVRLDTEVESARTLEAKNTTLDNRNRELVAEVERLRGEIEALKSRLGEKDSGPLTPWERFKAAIRGFELPLTMLVLGILVLFTLAIGSFIEGRRNKRRLSTIQEVVSAMSTSLESIGSGIVDAAKVFTKGQEIDETTGEEIGDADDAHVDVLERQASEAWQELQKKRPFVMEVLKDWLADKTKKTLFLRVCEAVGTAEAKLLWESFPKEETNALAPFLDRPMTRAQAFKSVLLLGRFVAKLEKSKVPFFGELNTDVLTSLTDDELAKRLVEQGADGVAMAMALLSPERSRRILSLMPDLDSGEIFSRVQASENYSDSDARDILDRIAQGGDVTDKDTGFDATDHLANILENGKSAEKRAVLESLRDNPDLMAKVQKQVLTFDMVLKLDQEILNEQLESLEPEDIASLVVSLGQEGQRILGIFSGKLLFRVQNEMGRMTRSAIGRKRAEKSGEKVQKLIVTRVKKLVDEGLIDMGTSPQSRDVARAS